MKKIVRGIQQDPNNFRKRTALREAVYSWLETGSEIISNYIHEFIQQPAPSGRKWPQLIETYAKDYPGFLNASVEGRLRDVAQLYCQQIAMAA